MVALLVEAVFGGEDERVDAAQLAVGGVSDRPLDRRHAVGIGRLPQHAEKGFAFAHRPNPAGARFPHIRAAKDLGVRFRCRKAHRRDVKSALARSPQIERRRPAQQAKR